MTIDPNAAPETLPGELQAQIAGALDQAVRGGIEPWRLYTARQAAELLGLDYYKSVYEIPEADLPRCWIGPNRGSLRFMGADLLCYAKGLPAVDFARLVDAFRDSLRRPSNVQPLPTEKGGKRRVF
jgi:hypothetical protein